MNSLYIHIPFCQVKCFYCSFVVSVGQRDRIDLYLESLDREAQCHKGARLKTIYIGGGTPTFLENRQLAMLVNSIRKNFILEEGVEFTMEANPEGLNLDKAQALYALGINRMSLGVQTLDDRHLKFLGRCHDSKTAMLAFHHLRKAGFSNISIDLMYSFPNQTEMEIVEDIKEITKLDSEHLSLYTLTIEENSRFYVRKIKEHQGPLQAGQYRLVLKLLERAGFYQYEVSNFAKPGRESRHNMIYWTGGNYIGLGVGAHSHRDGHRSWNVSRLNVYLSRMKDNMKPVEAEEVLSLEKRLMELLLLGLRMNQGVDVRRLEGKLNCPLGLEKESKVDEFISQGLLFWDHDHLKATEQGRLVLDEISARLI